MDWLDAAQDAHAFLDVDLRLRYANVAFETLAGRSFDDCDGWPLARLRPFGDATEKVLALLARALGGDDDTDAELAWRPCGSELELHHQVQVRGDRSSDGSITMLLLAARDVTRFRETERSLRQSQAEFRTLADNSPDNIIRYGLDGRATYCNQEIGERMDTTVRRVVGALPHESAPPGSVEALHYEQVVIEALRTGRPGHVEIAVTHPEGGQAIHSVLIRAERDTEGAIIGALAIGRDVTDLVTARQLAAEREREFRTLADNAGDQIARWDAHARYVYANPRTLDMIGLPKKHIYGRTTLEVSRNEFQETAAAIDRVIAGAESELFEQRFVDRRDGLEHIQQVLCVPERDAKGSLVSVLGVGRDITESVRSRETLERIAHTDLLTGVPNSQALFDQGPAMLSAAQRTGGRVGVLLLDLDGFRAVNDTVGHAGGDAVLRAVAERVVSRLRPGDLFVRLGGDEFVIVATDIADDGCLQAVAEEVLDSLTTMSTLPVGRGTRIGASIGVAVFPQDGTTIEALVSHADTAMYQAKRSGRGRVEYFHKELGIALQRKAAIERALQAPDLADELVLHLQPVFHFGPQPTLAGAEALVRWRHATLGNLMPDEFIPIAEETGAIVVIGRWVLQEATAIAARWNRGRSPALAPLTLAVNFSTRQFALDDLVVAVAEALAANGCDARWLIAEITEGLLLEDSDEIQATLRHLRESGVRIAVDDFGTGYSALHYLTRFPLDMLKIDRRFIQGVGVAAGNDELVKALVALAGALGLDVVAEGIETSEQLGFLMAQKCDLVQGFLLGRPVPVDSFEADHGAGRWD